MLPTLTHLILDKNILAVHNHAIPSHGLFFPPKICPTFTDVSLLQIIFMLRDLRICETLVSQSLILSTAMRRSAALLDNCEACSFVI